MASDWSDGLTLMTFIGVATLFVSFFGRVAWGHRQNRFSFFCWVTVLVVFMLIYSLTFMDYVDSWK
jgi:hypothetical protein